MERREQHSSGQESNEAKTEASSHDGSSHIITIVFLMLLIDLLGFTLILPLLPSILEYYGKTDHDGIYQSLQHSVAWFADMIGVPSVRKYNSVLFGGLIGSMFSVLQFLVSPVTGAASDHFGRRPLMMLTTAGLIASYALWALSQNFGIFLLSRIVGGISKGNVSLSTAIIADLPSPRARSKGMAMIGVAFSLGFTIGPMIGAYFASSTGKDGSFFLQTAQLALVFAVSDLVFIFLFLPETLPREKRVTSISSTFQNAIDLLSPVALLKFSAVQQRTDSPSPEGMRTLKVLGLVYFLYLFLFSGLEYTLSFLTHQRFHFNSMQQGKMFFFVGITMALVQGGYARRIKPGDEVKAVKRAIALLIPAFLIIGWANTVLVLYIGLLFYSFAAAIVIPCLSALVSGYGAANQKGTVMGILRSLGALARALGPVVAATVYWLAGAEVCFTVTSFTFLIPLALLTIPKVKKTE
ncbi:major facilitator superfamily domain-containing protein 10 isoform X1 [Chiloscyllium plagiosum]|uniref:major facilitator superfamily domain-containing protein 10 isoform X1 n=2 Tax=Chiloscyllium plagiosum TaxID=36176 RepID=UPI001CB87F5E|nr:major facilitator superfamily domain-containing protein 10 isoform X1 [Chiloscyllium plagiosum]XP_043559746.1 major facilitator superfamily domain-containing protein 10 isoform X1 [Chiloscyllium plagiosum]XP_043559755.1 major facilitator superfamily domain-containing protein 10 isoform X1 [Chiloscyllium plagiosum]